MDIDSTAEYREIGIRSHGKGIFHKPNITGKELGDKRVFHVVPNALVLNIVFAWEQAVAVTSDQEVGMIASHRFPMYLPKEELCDVEYLRQVFCTPRGKEMLELSSPGGAGRNKTLGQSEFEKLKIMLPPIDEQRKIRKMLQVWDRAVAVTEMLITQNRLQKQALMKSLLKPKKPNEWHKFHWQRVPLSEVAFIDRRSLPSSTSGDFRFRYISLSDVGRNGISSKLAEYTFNDAPSRARRLVEDGDILFSTVRPNLMGHVPITDQHADCVVSTGFSTLSAKPGVDPRYLFQCLFSEEMSKQIDMLVAGSSFPAIASSEIVDLEINLPNQQEQARVGSILGRQDTEALLLQKFSKALSAEKRALVQQLLAGNRRLYLTDTKLEALDEHHT